MFANFDSKTDVRIHSVTDHYGVILSTTMQTYTPKQTCFESRNWKKLERVQTRLEFNSLIKEKIQEHITGHENAKEMLTVIEQSILEALDKVVPCKKITPRQEDRKWITNQVKNSCTKKQAAWIRFANQRTDELYDKFKQQRNKTKQIIRTAKKCYYMKIFSKENDKNNKKFYKFVKNLKDTTSESPDDDINISAEAFNNFFTQIGPKLASAFNDCSNLSYIKTNVVISSRKVFRN